MSQSGLDLNKDVGSEEEKKPQGKSSLSSRFPKWRDYLDPRFLGGVSTAGVLNLTRLQGIICWSGDNQVALVTDGGGVTVVDFVHTHDQLESGVIGFTGNETNFSCIKPVDKNLENYMGVPLSRVLLSRNKADIFDIVRDPIICPKELINGETHLYYTKVRWTCYPLTMKSVGSTRDDQYVLAALDSHFTFRLFTKRQTASKNGGDDAAPDGVFSGDDWQIFIDLTETYRNLLIAQFWSINVTDESQFSSGIVDEYKLRMYQLATVDFIWLPRWEDEILDSNNVRACLVTAHASGDVCIWHLCAIPARGSEPGSLNFNYFLTLEFRKKLITDEIISHLDFYKLSPTLGILLIGTTTGSVKLFKISYDDSRTLPLKPLPADEEVAQKYFLDEEVTICKKDLLEIQSTQGVISKINKGHEVILFLFKHPNFMFTFKLKIMEKRPIQLLKTDNPTRIVNGVLVGTALMKNHQDPNKTVLLAVTQRGTFSWMNLDNEKVKEVANYDLGAAEELSKDQLKKRLQYGGLAVSPNGAMVCVSKTLAEYFDHLALRTPSVLQFHSVFPTENVWPFVLTKCVLNQFKLQTMGDVLTAYRILMSTSETYLKDVLDWAVPLKSKSLNDLQILFWVLKIQPKVDKDQLALAYNLRKEEPNGYHQLKSKQIRAIRRETLVSDLIIQLRCLDLVNKIVANPSKYNLDGNLPNLQSLMTMYDYLETKKELIKAKGALPRKPRVLVNPPPRKPACPLCGKPTKVMDLSVAERPWKEGTDYVVEHELDKEEIDGVLWHEQQHTHKSRTHPISNCVLSLIPISFPYRKCNFCGPMSMTSPTFNQEPICPFCNGLMESPGEYYEEEELEEGSEELEKLINEFKKEQEEELAAKQKAAPLSRKARIENMYAD